MIDLEAYYDYQVVNIYRIVQESIEVDQYMVKLFVKVLPRFKYHIHAYYRVSPDFCRGYSDQLGGVG